MSIGSYLHQAIQVCYSVDDYICIYIYNIYIYTLYIYTLYIYVDILYIHSWHQTVQVSSGPSDMKYFFLLFKQCHLDGGQ